MGINTKELAAQLLLEQGSKEGAIRTLLLQKAKSYTDEMFGEISKEKLDSILALIDDVQNEINILVT